MPELQITRQRNIPLVGGPSDGKYATPNSRTWPDRIEGPNGGDYQLLTLKGEGESFFVYGYVLLASENDALHRLVSYYKPDRFAGD